jgi:hypothetical protein
VCVLYLTFYGVNCYGNLLSCCVEGVQVVIRGCWCCCESESVVWGGVMDRMGKRWMGS